MAQSRTNRTDNHILSLLSHSLQTTVEFLCEAYPNGRNIAEGRPHAEELACAIINIATGLERLLLSYRRAITVRNGRNQRSANKAPSSSV